MPIILYNLEWMSFNIFLALLGIDFAFLLFKSQNLLLKATFFILWMLFVPNTIYVLTDLQHLPEQFGQLEASLLLILILQYLTLIVVGVITFILSLYLFEKTLSRLIIKKQSKILILIVLNYLISFGVALGRFERINSWFMFTEPERVLISTLNLLQSPEIMLIIFLFGSLINTLYLFLRKSIKP